MKKTISCLDKGFVTLLEIYGDVKSIADAARISYSSNKSKERTTEQDERLVKRLLKDNHTSPLEMVSFKFHLKLPMFVLGHMVRHRTAKLNVESLRYSEFQGDYYLPELDNVRTQHAANKQMSGEKLDAAASAQARDSIQANSEAALKTYRFLIDSGVAREQARMVLPSNIYTEMVWLIDLHNLRNFLRLRLAIDAQPETRVFAEAIKELIAPSFPFIFFREGAEVKLASENSP
jgi:thymidylate synthase (FAD)